MTQYEDLVWNAITDSAKKKFDYKSFEEQFSEIDVNLADSILFKILVGFASEKTDEIISYELYSEMMMIGFLWKLEDIKDFIKGKDETFKLEIYLCQLSNSLLDDGTDPAMVLSNIRLLLN